MKSTSFHSTSKTPLVHARGLTKQFNQHTAVDGIDFDIYPGEIVGFLGPNGAGKTTTIRMLLNLLNPTRGELTLFGHTYQDQRTQILQQINSSSGTLSLPGKLSVEESLLVFGDLFGLRQLHTRVDTLLEQFDLIALRKRPLYSLSTGQQVRAAMAKAFLNRPKLVLLDEPTASLDPDVADRIRSYLLQAVKNENTTVFLTSHNMKEVEQVCSRVLFINNGKIEAEGSPRALARQVKRWKIVLKTSPSLRKLPSIKPPKEAEVSFEGDILRAEMDKDHVGPFLTKLIQTNVKIETIHIQEPTLEDFFVHSVRK